MSRSGSLLTVTGHGEAPGRLDFMGGVADYSGSMVLEMPIAGKTRVDISYLPQPQIILHSKEFGEHHFNFKILRSLFTTHHTHPQSHNTASDNSFLTVVRQHLVETNAPMWTRYIIGCLVVFVVKKNWLPGSGVQVGADHADTPLGLRFNITSEVNSSMGVSSSAALEMATLRALSSLSHATQLVLSDSIPQSLYFQGTEIAHLGQLAENRIVGAPCGLMDQLSTAFGLPNHLLPILCRPDILYANIALPANVAIVGWPSGIKHSVGESPYSRARAAAFMGKKIMEKLTGTKVAFTAEFSQSTVLAPHPAFALTGEKGYSHSHSNSPFPSRLSLLPVSMLGADFLSQYEGVDDTLSVIKPDMYYPVRDGFLFPIQENFRCQLAASLFASIHNLPPENIYTNSNTSTPNNPFLSAPPTIPSLTRSSILRQVGELLYQSHRGYSLMGLGCPETDAIISILQSLESDGVYGCRISGGGSGGTVAILCEKSAIEKIRAELKKFKSSAKLDLIIS